MTVTLHPGAVVVGVDDAPPARLAADWAAAEAELRGATLQLVHVVDTGAAQPLRDLPPDATEQAVKEAGILLDDTQARLTDAHPDLRVNAALVRGRPAEAILDVAADAAMVVIGTRGRGGFAGLLLGSASLKVAAHANCPVVVVRGQADVASGADIVVGVRDERDADAVRFALAEAHLRKAPVRLVHTWSPFAQLSSMVPQVSNLSEEESLHQQIVNRAAAPVAEYPDVHVDTDLVVGPTAGTLVDASASAGLLVLPRHHPGTGIGRHLGAVLHAVLHHAHCPVAVVPTE